jgi:hypothetical protein
MHGPLESALVELVHGPPLGPEGLAALAARHALEPATRAALEADLERWLVYRTLVRNTLRNAVSLAIPRTLARLGGLFDEAFDRFLAERGPRTHYLRDVTSELLDFVAPLWRADPRVPPWSLDLARHEALEIVVASLADPLEPHALGELDVERGLRFIEAARVVRYEYAVQRLSADEADRTAPAREPTALFVYRDAEHDVRYLELTPLAADLLEALLAGESLKAALLRACAREAVEPAQALSSVAELLAGLAARGALLGPAGDVLASERTLLDHASIAPKGPHEQP